jgi:hypothetical protein
MLFLLLSPSETDLQTDYSTLHCRTAFQPLAVAVFGRLGIDGRSPLQTSDAAPMEARPKPLWESGR